MALETLNRLGDFLVFAIAEWLFFSRRFFGQLPDRLRLTLWIGLDLGSVWRVFDADLEGLGVGGMGGFLGRIKPQGWVRPKRPKDGLRPRLA